MTELDRQRTEQESNPSPVTVDPWLQAMLTIMPAMARQVDTGDYAAEEASLEMQTSGAGIAEFSETQGISGELLAPLEALMNKRVADGHGGATSPV